MIDRIYQQEHLYMQQNYTQEDYNQDLAAQKSSIVESSEDTQESVYDESGNKVRVFKKLLSTN